jgi:phosphohistidine phosphatase
MAVYLVRHGKAEQGTVDDVRALTDGGRKAVQRMARWMGAAEVHVERVEHSGLVRAEQTAEILARVVGGRLHRVADLGPTDPVEPVAARLTAAGEEEIMLVGHLPFMERLAAYLLTGDAGAPMLHFRTGAVACLSREGTSWTLEWFLAPSLL